MGVIVSSEDRLTFMQLLRVAGEIGWSEPKIRSELKLSGGDFKKMATGNRWPSMKHLIRLKDLLQSDPPKRVLPPAPSKPVVKMPPFASSEALNWTKDAVVASSPPPPAPVVETTLDMEKFTKGMDDQGQAPAAETTAPPGREEEPHMAEESAAENTKSEEPMKKTPRKKDEVPSSRHTSLSKASTRDLKRKIIETLKSAKYQGKVAMLATDLRMHPETIYRLLRSKTSLASQMMADNFQKLTGYSRGGAVSTGEPEVKKIPLPPSLLIPMRTDLARLAKEHGIGQVAEDMGCDYGTIRLIIGGKGSSYRMYAKYEKYKARMGGSAPAAGEPAAAEASGFGPLPKTLLSELRKELAEEVAEHGMRTVAAGVDCSPATISYITSGGGSTFAIRKKWLAYKAKRDAQPVVVEMKKPLRPKEPAYTNGFHIQVEKPTTVEAPTSTVDLYSLAGRLLGAGNAGDAHVLSLIARVRESVPLGDITSALEALLEGGHPRSPAPPLPRRLAHTNGVS